MQTQELFWLLFDSKEALIKLMMEPIKDITIKLRGNTNETVTAALNNSGNASGAVYTSIELYPTAPSVTITGNRPTH
jgi:hypothetical protein